MRTGAADHLAELQPGALIAERYRVERTLGSGGMGVVLAARHVTLGQPVAIKLMLPEALAGEQAVERFMREAWAASRIKSEYVTRVFDMGELPSGMPYLVMECLDGEDLGSRLKRECRLSVDETTTFVLQVCEALAEAHALGIVHRDLKPSNVFCVRRSDGLLSIKVLDFGISKLTADHSLNRDRSLTTTRSLIGSPFYMSPEQMRSPKSVDGRTDVWSLGVMLYEMLGGEPPFSAETLPELAVRIATEPHKPLASLRPELPRGLFALVNRCLEKEREKRFADIGKVARALVPFAPQSAHVHAERAERVLRHAAAVSDSAPTSESAPARSVSPRTWKLAVALVGLAGLVWLAYTAWPRPEPAPHVVMPLQPTAAQETSSSAAIDSAPEPKPEPEPEQAKAPPPAPAPAKPRPKSAAKKTAQPPTPAAPSHPERDELGGRL